MLLGLQAVSQLPLTSSSSPQKLGAGLLLLSEFTFRKGSESLATWSKMITTQLPFPSSSTEAQREK